MKLKEYTDKLKQDKSKDILSSLTLDILKTEECIVESNDKKNLISVLKEMLDDAFLYIKENKIEINSDIDDLDLDYWKDNVGQYRSTNPDMSNDVYLYSIRNSLKHLLENKKDKKLQKAYIFEIVIKTFLFIDFMNLSILKILGIN